ncbi:hypothetical protein VPNG_02117 [Cytospora leucostoma]|uniref:AMMECR1 domain-containing protein n=1 Tax=Cytospora leucostoma TaxID=1230097 RepID=A0A423XI43_9PEZI|nr:hypothetical protein VPNG_02117 [Cytospora leucostoma]
MATVEHCLFCFESLVAELEGREPLELGELQKSYAEYTKAQLASQEEDDDDDDEEEDEGEGEGEGEGGASQANKKPAALKKKIPALRRLVGSGPSENSLASSSSGANSGSSSSTSLLSANTSATSISTATAPGGDGPQSVTDPSAEYPLFVTWNKDEDGDGEYSLRGCIGTFEAQPLADGLSSYAVIAALHDSRFRRVARGELPALQCAVTLLTGFEDAAHMLDWEVGTHGVRISFRAGGRRYGATYLPDVAREQGWTREQALVSLMRKAGWEGRRDRWREVAEAGGLKVVRYRGDKESVVYGEYKAWRDWADEN